MNHQRKVSVRVLIGIATWFATKDFDGWFALFAIPCFLFLFEEFVTPYKPRHDMTSQQERY